MSQSPYAASEPSEPSPWRRPPTAPADGPAPQDASPFGMGAARTEPASGTGSPFGTASTPDEAGLDAGGPWFFVDEPRPPRRTALTAVQAIGVLLSVVALGWPLGVLWQAVAPNIPVLVVADGAVYDDSQPEQFMGGDGWFALLGLGFGIAVAVLTWMLCRQLRGPLGMLVLAIGGTAAAIVAWKVGRDIGVTEYLAGLHSAAEGTHLSKPNDLRIAQARWWPPKLTGVLLIPALGSTLAMGLMAAWSSFATLRRDDRQTVEDPPAQPTAQPG